MQKSRTVEWSKDNLVHLKYALKNQSLLAKTGIDTAENEPFKVWRRIQYYSFAYLLRMGFTGTSGARTGIPLIVYLGISGVPVFRYPKVFKVRSRL